MYKNISFPIDLKISVNGVSGTICKGYSGYSGFSGMSGYSGYRPTSFKYKRSFYNPFKEEKKDYKTDGVKHQHPQTKLFK